MKYMIFYIIFFLTSCDLIKREHTPASNKTENEQAPTSNIVAKANVSEDKTKCHQRDKAFVSFVTNCKAAYTLSRQMGGDNVNETDREKDASFCRCVGENFNIQKFADENCSLPSSMDFYFQIGRLDAVQATCSH